MPGDPPTWRGDRLRRLEDIGRALLVEIGEDPTRPGLLETPARWARMWLEFAEYRDPSADTVFGVNQVDQMVVVRGVRVWSFCEHHLLPFSCDLTVGYIVRDRMIGLSKIGRLAHREAHRLQVQERLTDTIAHHVARLAGHEDVAVLGDGEHLCMTMRGPRTSHRMSTSNLRGVFRTDQSARQEFYHLAAQPVTP